MKAINKDIPYNDLPLLPPKADLETTKILKKVITSSRALSQLNGAITNLPNPQLFLDTIHLQEAKASSEMSRNQILRESAIAMLSQANSTPQLALNLLP